MIVVSASYNIAPQIIFPLGSTHTHQDFFPRRGWEKRSGINILTTGEAFQPGLLMLFLSSFKAQE